MITILIAFLLGILTDLWCKRNKIPLKMEIGILFALMLGINMISTWIRLGF
jgi:hypothetical protein